MRRSSFFARWGKLVVAAILVAGFMPNPIPVIGASDVQKIQASEPATVPPTEPERPLTPEEQKAVDARRHFDRVLVDAAVLLTDFENYKRGKTRTPISMSAFRNLEIELNAIADADPSNDQARDMAKQMQMAQFEILQPSVAVAAVASRQLYADKMSQNLQSQDVRAVVSGRGARVVRFMSRQMTRELGQNLLDSAKIADQARGLQFERVVFTNGRRSWTYNVETGRYR